MMKKVIKLSSKQLRSLISEAIEAKPAGSPEPFQIDEEFGSNDDKPTVHNFESSHHELFHQALQPTIDEMVKSSMKIYDEGYSPEGRNRAKNDVKQASEQMREELLEVVAKWSEEIVNRIA